MQYLDTAIWCVHKPTITTSTPPVFTAIRTANIPCCDLFESNNSSWYARPNDIYYWWDVLEDKSEVLWKFLCTTVESQKLTSDQGGATWAWAPWNSHPGALTTDQNCHIHNWMNYSKKKKVLAILQVQASDLEQQDFTYTVKVVKVDLEPVEYVWTAILFVTTLAQFLMMNTSGGVLQWTGKKLVRTQCARCAQVIVAVIYTPIFHIGLKVMKRMKREHWMTC